MAETHTGEPVSSSISQEAATDWKNPPTLLNTEAIHSARNRGRVRGRVSATVTIRE